MDTDLEVLSDEECRRLLGTVPIGRLVFTDRAMPAVHPVNFLLGDGEVLVRLGYGSALAAAVGNTVVAFQADAFDPDLRTGWSVLVTGRARLVDDPRELAALERGPLQSWAPGERDYFVAIPMQVLSGRRIRRG